MPTLVGRSGPLAGRRFELDDELILGREGATITLADEETSRRHAAIRIVDGAVVIEDLGSTNGTFVDGRRIDAVTELSGGETIRLGQTTFSIEVEPAPEPIAEPGATRLASRPDPVADRGVGPADDRPVTPEPVADADATTLRPRAPRPEPVADADATTLRPRAPRPKPAPAAADAEPAARAPAAPDQLFGAFTPPAPRRRQRVASRKLGPTIVSFATIIVTAVALVVYFAGR